VQVFGEYGRSCFSLPHIELYLSSIALRLADKEDCHHQPTAFFFFCAHTPEVHPFEVPVNLAIAIKETKG
jgi:hypothetical protein